MTHTPKTPVWYNYPGHLPRAVCKLAVTGIASDGAAAFGAPSYHCPKCDVSTHNSTIVAEVTTGGFDCVTVEQCTCGTKFVVWA